MAVEPFTARDGAKYCLIMVICTFPPTFDAPVRWVGSHRNIAITFGMENLELFGYPHGKNFIAYDYSFWQDSRM